MSGAMVLCIAVAHIFLPTWGYSAATTDGMSPQAKEHFYFLGTYAICTFLFAFGILSLVYSRASSSAAAGTFAAVMTVVWWLRVGLELLYPVRVPLFIVTNPHPTLVVVLVTIALGFTLAWVNPVRR